MSRFAPTVTLLLILPVSSHAQMPSQAAKPTLADVDRVLNRIAQDTGKLQTYCNLTKLNEQIAQAEQKNDMKTLEQLGPEADRLEEALGPDYSNLMIGLEQVEPDSQEGKSISAAFAGIDQRCR